MSCVCERREWEFGEKTSTEALQNDRKLLKHKLKRVSSLEKKLFKDAYSNHLTFTKIRVLSSVVKSVYFSVSIEQMRKCEIR